MTGITPNIVNTVSTGGASTVSFITVFFPRSPNPQDISDWRVGQRWIDTSAGPDEEYILQGFVAANGVVTANWQQLGHTDSQVDTLTGDTGGPVPVDANNNINILGTPGEILVTGTPGNNTLTISSLFTPTGVETLSDDVGTVITPTANNIQLVGHVNEQGSTKFSTVVAGSSIANINPMSAARWIVDGLGFNGTHTTITAAIAAATSGDTIWILPGTYTENFTLKAGVSLVATQADGLTPNVNIVGKITITAAGNFTICGVQLQTNGDYFLQMTGSGASIVNIQNCVLNCTNNNGINYTTANTTSELNFTECDGLLQTTGITYFVNSGTGTTSLYYCFMPNAPGNTTQSTLTAGDLNCFYSLIYFPIITSGSTAHVAFQYCLAGDGDTAVVFLTHNSTSTPASTFRFCDVETSSASCIAIGAGAQITMEGSNDLVSSATFAVSGTGSFIYDVLSFGATTALDPGLGVSFIATNVCGSSFSTTGNATLGSAATSVLSLRNTTSPTASAGAGGALPVTVQGYVNININGSPFKIAIYPP